MIAEQASQPRASLESSYTGLQNQLETVLVSVSHSLPQPTDQIVAQLVTAGGKRARPALTFLANGAAGGKLSEAMPVALAVELLHSASLLHDDVVDDASLRRGLPAARVTWGNPVAVLAGDFCFFEAFRALLDLDDHQVLDRAVQIAGELVEGELLQLERRQKFVVPTIEDYLLVVERKTGALFGLAGFGGAYLAEKDRGVAAQLEQFGRQVGVLFQIVDDVLDLTATSEQMGKRLGQDLADGVVTLPIAFALEDCPELLPRVRDLAQLHREGNWSEDDVEASAERLIAEIAQTNALRRCNELAGDKGRSALELLKDLPGREYLPRLESFVHSILERLNR